MERRDFLKLTAALAAVPMFGPPAGAAEIAQLKILIPSGPGGGWDTTGRAVDKALRGAGLVGSSRITNVAGAGGTVGLATFVNQFRRDPNALMVGGLVMVTNILSNKAPVNLTNVIPIARLTGEYEAVAVPANSPYKTLGALLADFKADPQKVSWVGGSAGGTDHIVAALIGAQSGIPASKLTYIGYPSGGEIQAAVLGGQATVGVSGLSEFSEHVASGGMRLLGITAPERVAGIDVPTLREQGIDVEISNWRGLFAAPDITDKQQAALLGMVDAMVKTDVWAQELKTRNWTSVYLPGSAFAAFVAAETTRIAATLKELGLA